MRHLNALLKDVDEKTGLDEKTLTNQDNEDVKNQAVLTANLMDDIMSKHILEKSGGFSDSTEKGGGGGGGGKGNKESDPVQLTSAELNGRIAKEASLLGPQAISKLDVYGSSPNNNDDTSQKVNKLKQATNFRLIPSLTNTNELMQTSAGSGITNSITNMLSSAGRSPSSAAGQSTAGLQQFDTQYGESKKKTISPSDVVTYSNGGGGTLSAADQQLVQDASSSKFNFNIEEQNKVASFSPLSSLVANEHQQQVDSSFAVAPQHSSLFTQQEKKAHSLPGSPGLNLVENYNQKAGSRSSMTGQQQNTDNPISTFISNPRDIENQLDTRSQNSLFIEQSKVDSSSTLSLIENDGQRNLLDSRSSLNLANDSPQDNAVLNFPGDGQERILLGSRTQPKISSRLIQNNSFPIISTLNRTRRNSNDGVLFSPKHSPPLLPPIINNKNNSKDNNDQWFMVQIPDRKSGRIMISFGNESSNQNAEVSNYNLSQATWEFSTPPVNDMESGDKSKYFYITNVTNAKQPVKYLVKEGDIARQEKRNDSTKENLSERNPAIVTAYDFMKNGELPSNVGSAGTGTNSDHQKGQVTATTSGTITGLAEVQAPVNNKNAKPHVEMNSLLDIDTVGTDHPKVPANVKNMLKNSSDDMSQPGTISLQLNNKTVKHEVSNYEQAEKVMHKVISMLSDVVDEEKAGQTAALVSKKFVKLAPNKHVSPAQGKRVPAQGKQHVPVCDEKHFQNCIVPKELKIDPAIFQRKQITRKHKYQFQAHDWKQVIKEMLSGIGKLKQPNATHYGVTVHGVMKQVGVDAPPVSLNLTLSMKNLNDDFLRNDGSEATDKVKNKSGGNDNTPKKEETKNEKVEQEALNERKKMNGNYEMSNNNSAAMTADQKSIGRVGENNTEPVKLHDSNTRVTSQSTNPIQGKVLSGKDNNTIDSIVESIVNIIRNNSKDEISGHHGGSVNNNIKDISNTIHELLGESAAVSTPKSQDLIGESPKPQTVVRNTAEDKQSANTKSEGPQLSNKTIAVVDVKKEQPVATMEEIPDHDIDATRAKDIKYVQKLLHKYAQRYTDDYYMHQYVKKLMKKLLRENTSPNRPKNVGFKQLAQQQQKRKEGPGGGAREELNKSGFDNDSTKSGFNDDSTKTYIDNLITKITKTLKQQKPKMVIDDEVEDRDKSLSFLTDCIKSDEEECTKRHNPLVSPNATAVDYIEKTNFTSAEALFDVLKLNGALLNLINLLRTKNVNIDSNNVNLLKSILIMMNRFYSKTDGVPMKIDSLENMKDFSEGESMLDILELNGALLNLIHLLEIKDVDLKPSNVDLVKAILNSMNMFYAEFGGDPAVELPKNGAASTDQHKENIALDGQKLHDLIVEDLKNRSDTGLKVIKVPESAKGKENTTDELTKPKDEEELAKNKPKEELRDHYMPSEKEIHDMVIEQLKKIKLNTDTQNLVSDKPTLTEMVEHELKKQENAVQSLVMDKPLTTTAENLELKNIFSQHQDHRKKFLNNYLPSDEDLHEMVVDDLMQKTAVQNALNNNETKTQNNNVAYLHNYDVANDGNMRATDNGDNEFFTKIEALHKPMSVSIGNENRGNNKPGESPIEELHRQILGMDDVEAIPSDEQPSPTNDRNPHDVFMHGNVYDDLLREGDVSKIAVNATKRGFRVLEQIPGDKKQPSKVTFKTGDKRTQLIKPLETRGMKRRSLHKTSHLSNTNSFITSVKRMHSGREPMHHLIRKNSFKRKFSARRSLWKRLRKLHSKNYRGYKRDSIVNNIVSTMNSLYHEVNSVVDEIKKQKDNPNYNVQMKKAPDNKTEMITATIYGKPADSAHIKDETTTASSEDLMNNERIFEMERDNNDRYSKRTLSFISSNKDLPKSFLKLRHRRALRHDYRNKALSDYSKLFRRHRDFMSDDKDIPIFELLRHRRGSLRHRRAIVDDDMDDKKISKIKFIKPKIRIIQSHQLGNYSTNDAERILIPLYT